MFITKKHISRRTVLKGMGVTLALPFLDAMVPAGTDAARRRPPRASGRTRLVAMEMVHGSAGSAPTGWQQNMWSPAATGTELRSRRRRALKSLEPYREYLTIISNTKNHARRRGRRRRSAATTSGRARPT